MADFELGGVLRGRSGSVLPGVAPSNVYPTADGAEVVIAGNADSVFTRLCRVMGQPELSTDERYATHGARGANMDELDERIGAWTATLPAAVLLERLEAGGVPAGQIFTAREMLEDPQYQARQMVQRHLSYQGWEVPMNGIVPRFTRTPGAVRHTGQPLGQDTEAVLRDLAGCSADEIDELAKAGLI
jgi:formyl-CoA transferase/succinyl-CoA--D-citramalate CoA-transferase